MSVDDGLSLRDAYVSAVVRCAPPANKPSIAERDRCLPYMREELRRLERVRVIVALGGFAFTNVLAMLRDAGEKPTAKPRFGHGAIVKLDSGRSLIGCYHPSQQNTFTGRLTETMLDDVFNAARSAACRDGRRTAIRPRRTCTS